ncbi:hypothetical protein VdG1_03010 [Verticillium dahliae VDG1]|nr:hypothetical protein VdG1_03010 [Verticillium dahliae VDG1]
MPVNQRAKGVPFYTPAQEPAAGTALSSNPPTLFTPLQIRSKTLANRLVVTQADVVLVARQFLREPNFVLNIARELDVDVKWANQYHRAPRRKH